MEKSREQKYLETYTKFNKLFEEKWGYNLYFIGGSLLGLVREGGLLEGDKDMDVAWFSRKTTPIEIKREFLEISEELICLGLLNRNSFLSPVGYRILFFAHHITPPEEPDGMKIDFMCSFRMNNAYHRPTFVRYEGEELVLPLKKVNFKGTDVWIPNKPEEHLSKVYGEDWRTPKKNWDKQPFYLKSKIWKANFRTANEIKKILARMEK